MNPKKPKEPERKWTIAEVIQEIKDKNMSSKDAFDFIMKHNRKALVLMNPKRWEMEVKNPDRPPATKEEIEKYQDFIKRNERIKGSSEAKELSDYLSNQGYRKTTKEANQFPYGKQIILDAKRRGAKIQENEDGTFTVFDDETVVTDTDKSYGKGRTIHPDYQYARSTYNKGRDIVHVYDVYKEPAYKGNVPTNEEIEALKSGKYYTEAVTPEFKKYYADVYFDPNNPDAADKTFYGSDVSKQDIDRYKQARELGETLKPEFDAYNRRNKRKRAIKNALNTFVPTDLSSGAETLNTIGKQAQILSPVGFFGSPAVAGGIFLGGAALRGVARLMNKGKKIVPDTVELGH